MLGLSLEAANLWANRIYIGAGLVAIAATAAALMASFVMWRTNDALTALANERTGNIERATAWRFIPGTAVSKLVDALKDGPGGHILLSYPAGDPEAVAYSFQIRAIFLQANLNAKKDIWTIQTVPKLFSSSVYFDLRIYGPDPKILGPILRAFARAGVTYSPIGVPDIAIDLPGLSAPAPPPTGVAIFVGSRHPLPDIPGAP